VSGFGVPGFFFGFVICFFGEFGSLPIPGLGSGYLFFLPTGLLLWC